MSYLWVLGSPFIKCDLWISSDHKFIGFTRMPQKPFIRLEHDLKLILPEMRLFATNTADETIILVVLGQAIKSCSSPVSPGEYRFTPGKICIPVYVYTLSHNAILSSSSDAFLNIYSDIYINWRQKYLYSNSFYAAGKCNWIPSSVGMSHRSSDMNTPRLSGRRRGNG